MNKFCIRVKTNITNHENLLSYELVNKYKIVKYNFLYYK